MSKTYKDRTSKQDFKALNRKKKRIHKNTKTDSKVEKYKNWKDYSN